MSYIICGIIGIILLSIIITLFIILYNTLKNNDGNTNNNNNNNNNNGKHKDCTTPYSTCDSPLDSDNCKLTRPDNIDYYIGYVKFIKNTWQDVKGKVCNFEGGTPGDKDTLCKVKTTENDCPSVGSKKYCNWNDDGRPLLIYYPSTVITDESSRTNIPYIIFFSFVEWNTYDPANPTKYGIISPDKQISCITKDECDTYNEGWIHLQLQNFLSAGYAVVMTTMIQDDSYQYLNCQNRDEAKNLYNLCWNNGLNPDAKYLTEIFKQINNKTLMNDTELIYGESLLTPKPPGYDPSKLELNTTECGLMGYSVGSQTVSRYINEFGPNSTTVPDSPKVKVGIMISGGSLHCYEYCNADSNTERGVGKEICNKQPTTFGPCWNKKDVGCCPENLTEPIFDNGKVPYNQHPPVILVQTPHDIYADPRASYNYYETLKTHNVDTEIVTGLCGNHNLFPSAILRVLMFVVKHMGKSSLSRL